MDKKHPNEPPYTITETAINLIEKIGEAIGQLSTQTNKTLQLRRINRIRTIQGSLAIEGNTLSEEQITAILDGKRIIAPPKEILEVKNAITTYEQFKNWKPHSEKDLLKAHHFLMTGLLDKTGAYRHKGVGVMSRKKVIHMAPLQQIASQL